jgi:DNA polymerase zeta
LSGICSDCAQDPSTTIHALLSRQHLAQAKVIDVHKICASCSSVPQAEKVVCDSIDCPVLYARVAAERDVEDLGDVDELVERLKEVDVRSVRGEGLDW